MRAVPDSAPPAVVCRPCTQEFWEMPFRLFRRKPRVRFVYLRRSRRTGSTVMRCFQLCDLVRRHLGSHFDFGVVELPRFRDASAEMRWVNSQPSGVTYIFVKKAIDGLSRESLLQLHAAANAICLDYVDRSSDDWIDSGVDLHLACSVTGLERLQEAIRAGRISGATSLLLHHADPRLAALSHRHQHLPRMQAVYFGSLDNGFLPPDIARRLTVLQATNNAAFKASVRRLVDFNLHYCVRGRQPRAAKPFTKGFTAAACGANVVVSATVDDALHFLDTDYPYLVPSDDEADVLAVLDHAARTYGTAEWRRGLAAMEAIRHRIAPARLAQDCAEILQTLHG
jgi:hypothetical protein